MFIVYLESESDDIVYGMIIASTMFVADLVRGIFFATTQVFSGQTGM